MLPRILLVGSLLAIFPAASQAADPILWTSFPKLKEDEVTVVSQAGQVEKEKIEIVLTLPANVTWEKAVRALDGNGSEMAIVKVKDGNKTASFKVDVDKLAKLELCKAKAFGVLTGMYELPTKELADKGGYRITFTWTKD